jgi:internalin A
MQIDEYDRSKLVYEEYEIKNYLGEEEQRVGIFIENLDAGLQYLKDNNIKDFTLDTLERGAKGDKKQIIDFSFLKELKYITNLRIGVPLSKKTDITPIYELENLEELWTIDGFQLDMSYFPSLKLLLTGDLLKNTINYESLTELTNLLFSPKQKDLKHIQNLKSLEYIRMLQPKIETLEGLENLPNLREVVIRNASKLQNIEHIALNSSIKDILFENIKNLTDFSVLAKSSSIEELCFWTTIDSLDFVPKMKSLETITFKNVKDGNLKPLLDSKTLEGVYFYPEKKHFSHKLDEINEILEKRHIG